MNGYELKDLMTIVGLTCEQVAEACGYDNIYRIVRARNAGTDQIPVFIESSISRLIGKDMYARSLDRLHGVMEIEIRKAKDKVHVPDGVELTLTQRHWLQTIAAQKKLHITLSMEPPDEPNTAAVLSDSVATTAPINDGNVNAKRDPDSDDDIEDDSLDDDPLDDDSNPDFYDDELPWKQ